MSTSPMNTTLPDGSTQLAWKWCSPVGPSQLSTTITLLSAGRWKMFRGSSITYCSFFVVSFVPDVALTSRKGDTCDCAAALLCCARTVIPAKAPKTPKTRMAPITSVLSGWKGTFIDNFPKNDLPEYYQKMSSIG